MEKEFIPYTLALDVKQLGFDEECCACYGSYTHKTSELFLNINNPVNIEVLVRERTGFNRPSFYVKTPTFSQAFRWFREKYGYFQLFDYQHGDSKINRGFFFNIVNIDNEDFFFPEDFKNQIIYKTYEEAELECLKKLISIVKSK